QVGEGLVADGAQRARRELESPLPLLDESGFLEHPRQLTQPVEGIRGIVTEQLTRAVEVDLRELAGLRRRTHEGLEVVEIAEGVEQPGKVAELERVVAAELL